MSQGSMFISLNSTRSITQAMQLVTNNLANANKTGFRADLPVFALKEVGDVKGNVRTDTVLEKTTVDFSHGTIITTGRDLDVAISDDGWIAVQNKQGKEGYTRAGNLHTTAEGLLVTAEGHFVLGNGGIIAIPQAHKTEIGRDGTISIRPIGGDETNLSTLDRIKLVNPNKNQLQKGEDGLLYLNGAGQAKLDANIRLIPGALETSNVNVVNEMVNMIDLSRQYEFQIKMMRGGDENSEAVRQLLNI